MADEWMGNEEKAEVTDLAVNQEKSDANTEAPEINAELVDETLSKGRQVGETVNEESCKEEEFKEEFKEEVKEEFKEEVKEDMIREMGLEGEDVRGERSEAEVLLEDISKSDNEFSRDDSRGKSYEELYDYILDRFKSFSPADEIAGQITEEHITEYLEGSREDRVHEYREHLAKRLLTAFELAAVLTAVILIVYFLKDNPAILVNILYFIGGLLALWIWKNPHKKDDK